MLAIAPFVSMQIKNSILVYYERFYLPNFYVYKFSGNNFIATTILNTREGHEIIRDICNNYVYCLSITETILIISNDFREY